MKTESTVVLVWGSGLSQEAIDLLSEKSISLCKIPSPPIFSEGIQNRLESIRSDAIIIFRDGRAARKDKRTRRLLKTLRMFRSIGYEGPVIGVWEEDPILVDDVVNFLNSGGDDLLWEPNPRLLEARLTALVRRTRIAWSRKTRTFFVAGIPVQFNPDEQSVQVNGSRIELCRQEYELFALLARRPNRILSYKSVRNEFSVTNEKEMSVHQMTVLVSKIRSKITEATGVESDFIKNVWGRGYRFSEYSSKAVA